MNVTFLDEAVQIGKLSDLPAYLKAKAKEDPDYLELLKKFEEEKSDWELTYPDFKTPSGWFPLPDGSIIIGCCDENVAFPIGEGYPFTFAILRLDDHYDPQFHWAATDYLIIIEADIFTDDEELWSTKELQKTAVGLAKKLTKEYASKKFADYPAFKKAMGTAPLYRVYRTGEPLKDFNEKPDASQKVKIEKRRN